MAHLDTCSFCSKKFIHPDICTCVTEFGLETEAKIKAWRLLFGTKPFLSDIKKALQSDKRKAYAEYTDNQKEKDNQQRLAVAFTKNLVEIQEKRISAVVAKRFDFKVSLLFHCTPVIRF